MKSGSEEHSLAMLRVAQLYYEQNLTQDQIATRLTLTRWKVGRLLDDARTHGIVTFQINHPRARRHEVEEQLVEKYGLEAAVVVAPDGSDDGTVAVASATAEYLCDLRPSPRVLGVSWGRTLDEVADRMPPGWARDVHVCQLNGALSRARRPSSGADVATEIARQAGGTVSLMSSPAILADPSTRDALVLDPTIGDVLASSRRADALVFSLGAAMPDSVLVEAGYLTRADIASLRERGAVGDVLGRFIDAAGREVDADLSARTMALTLDEIRVSTRPIAMAAGLRKVPVARAVVGSGLCRVLVTDSVVAEHLLEAA